jgi:hypothetical protein
MSRSAQSLTISVAAAAVLALQCSDAVAACLKPPFGLQAGHPNVDSETINFSFRGETFPVDLYSGFQATDSGNGAYCIRYEAENKAGKPIDQFYWPLASDLQRQYLLPSDRSSIIVSTLPGAPPVLDTTWLYAFLAEKAKSIAYQQSKFSLLISSSYAAIPINHNSRKVLKDTDEYPSSLLRLAQVEGTTSFELSSPKKFVEVGSQFNDKYSEVTATSFAD